MAFDLSGLSPEELAELKAAISAQNGGAHPDEEADNQWIQPIVQAVQYLAQQLDELKESHEHLANFINKDFIGGLQDLYSTNQRRSGIEALRSKYGDDFAPHDGYLKNLLGDKDLFEGLYDHLKGRWDDEDFDPDDEMDSILDELEENIAKMHEALGSNPEIHGVVKTAVIEPEGKEEEGEEPLDFSKEIERLKKMPGMKAAAGE